MKFVKCNQTKVVSVVLSLAVMGITAFNAASFFTGNNFMRPSSVCVSKIDENHAKLHCDSVKTSDSNFLISKSKVSDGFHYDISDLNGLGKSYGFDSETDIKFDEGVAGNQELDVAIWGAVAAKTALATAGAGIAVAKAGLAAAPVVGAVVGAGSVAAANGIGAGAGLYFGAAVVVAAAPAAVVAGAILGAASVG
jgi:hypothetical protein